MLPKFKAESIQLFRTVLDRYADVPCEISLPYFRDISKLGDKAKKSLHALEHLSIGAEAPEIVGKDLSGHSLNLKDYRGRIVSITFWFTGCGPCLALVPEERKLLETFKDRPFALLSVCTDDDLDMAQLTAKEHKIDWPCWFDGGNGPIAGDYNILSWPTLYLLDQQEPIRGETTRPRSYGRRNRKTARQRGSARRTSIRYKSSEAPAILSTTSKTNPPAAHYLGAAAGALGTTALSTLFGQRAGRGHHPPRMVGPRSGPRTARLAHSLTSPPKPNASSASSKAKVFPTSTSSTTNPRSRKPRQGSAAFNKRHAAHHRHDQRPSPISRSSPQCGPAASAGNTAPG